MADPPAHHLPDSDWSSWAEGPGPVTAMGSLRAEGLVYLHHPRRLSPNASQGLGTYSEANPTGSSRPPRPTTLSSCPREAGHGIRSSPLVYPAVGGRPALSQGRRAGVSASHKAFIH